MNMPVVITGLGVVHRDATDIPTFLDWLMPGGGLPEQPAHFDTSAFRARKAYAVDPDRLRPVLLPRLADVGAAPLSDTDLDCAAHGLAAAAEALAMAGLDPESRRDCGCVLATTSGGMMDRFADELTSGQNDILHLANAHPAATAEILVRAFGLDGPFANFSCACASSPMAISYALARLRNGDAEAMLVGGSDRMRAADFAGFNALRAMDRDSCRPFDTGRRGMVIGDGAAMLVLETETSARRRGARILGRLVEVGLSADAYHITHPDPDGLSRAMQQALGRAGLTPEDIAYVNCHGTGTPVNDRTEIGVLEHVFPAGGHRPLISSTKGASGHLLGSAGAIEAVITILAMAARQAPAMATTGTPEETGFPMPCGDRPQPFSGRYAMSNSLGFGGINSSLIFEAAD